MLKLHYSITFLPRSRAFPRERNDKRRSERYFQIAKFFVNASYYTRTLDLDTLRTGVVARAISHNSCREISRGKTSAVPTENCKTFFALAHDTRLRAVLSYDVVIFYKCRAGTSFSRTRQYFRARRARVHTLCSRLLPPCAGRRGGIVRFSDVPSRLVGVVRTVSFGRATKIRINVATT